MCVFIYIICIYRALYVEGGVSRFQVLRIGLFNLSSTIIIFRLINNVAAC